MLKLLDVGSLIGTLSSADDTRRVRSPDYLTRMFGRSDRSGKPLLSLGGLQGSKDIALEVIDGRAIAFLNLKNGRIEYEETISGLLPTIAKSLKTTFSRRSLLSLHQLWLPQAS